MPGTIILGYDIESASESTAGFLAGAEILHDRFEVPWTIYVTGQTLEQRTDDIRKAAANPRVTVGQHTYSHMLLKSVYMSPSDGKPVHGKYPCCFNPGGTVDEVRAEIERTQQLMRDRLGIECRGLTGPWCYYRGLADRPDLLGILRQAGIRWIRTNGRDHRDCQPTPFTEQPSFYADQGFPEILELGIQGYQDDFYWDRFDDRRHGDTYPAYLLAMVEEVARNDWTWSVCSHDHSCPTKEAFFATKGKWISELIERAKALGVRFVSPPEFYNERLRVLRPGKGPVMTPRERVLLAVDHRKTDRAPADYSAHQGVSDRLIAKLGVKDYEEMLCALGVDMRRVHFDYSLRGEKDSDGYWRDLWGGLRRDGDAGDGKPNYISPFNENTTVDDVHAHSWPDAGRLDCSAVKPACAKYHGEYAVFGAPWSPFFHEAGWLIGQEDFYVWMSTKPEVVEAIVGHIVDYEVAATRRFLEAAEGMIDIAYFGNDFGTQRGLFISPAMWHRFMRRPLKRYFDVSHEYGCKVMKHSCGSVRDIIPFLIEDGVDVLDPIQVAARGMDLAGLVRDYGGRLAFHGAVDTQRTLPFGSPADVRAEVRGYIDLTRERGGYIVCGSQEYIEDIPLDNILAIYDENKSAR